MLRLLLNMYAQSKSQSKSSKSAPKPFCKVCKDAGKSEAEYNSHFVKSEPGVNGVVICPTLLSQACTYCHRAGHTVGYCEVLKKFKNTKDAQIRRDQYVRPAIPKAKQNSIFDVLGESSDEEPKAKIAQKVDEYPVLPTTIMKLTLPLALPVTKTVTYANMAAKPMPVEVENETYAITTPTIAQYVEKAYTNTFKEDWSKKSKNWADWSDSDEE